jgi:hypothetical protein
MSSESAPRPSAITSDVATEVWAIVNAEYFTDLLRTFEEHLAAAGIALVRGGKAVALSEALTARAASAVARAQLREKCPLLSEAEVARQIAVWVEEGSAAAWIARFVRALARVGIVPQGQEQHVEVAPSRGELLFPAIADVLPPVFEEAEPEGNAGPLAAPDLPSAARLGEAAQ